MKKLLLLNIAAMLLIACQLKGSNTTTATEETAATTEKTAEGTEVGCKFIDIRLSGIYGVPISVSEYVTKNKYTLVDFWASWCGPCRAEMPTIVKAYADYHGRGFEVVGTPVFLSVPVCTANLQTNYLTIIFLSRAYSSRLLPSLYR